MTDSQDTTAQEIWKAIPGYPGYEVSNHGKVRSYWKRMCFGRGKEVISVLHNTPKRILKQNTTGSRRDYLQVNLCKDGKRYPKATHRLVLEAFICPCPDGLEGCHDDGNSKNNHLSNLRWGTKKSNESDKKQHGTYQSGANNHQAKITLEIAENIRCLAKRGMKQSEIAKSMNISRAIVYKVVHNKSWQGVTP